MSQNKKLYEIAKKGRDDLYYLAKNILGYDRMRDKPHKELSDFLKNSKRRTKLILMPRGSFKSSVVTVGYTIQSLIQDPNKTILISSETQGNAIKFVGEIKGHFEQNEKFKKLYGDWANRGNIWKSNEFVIRPRKKVRKESSVSAGSLEKGTQVGMHYDTVILDDCVSINNISSDAQIQKTIDHYKLLLSILNPDGEIIVIGTRWGFLELYSWLSDPEGPEYDQVETFIREAEDSEGNLLMPEVLNREFLDQQLKTQGSYIYSCQYLNNPQSSGLNCFKKEHIQYYKEAPNNLVYFLTIDPAISLKAESDYTGFILNGVDYYGNWYIVEAIQERVEPSDLINKVFEINQKYSPIMCIGMEKFALEKVLKKNLEEAMMRRKIFIPIKDLPTNTRVSKEARIRALQPVFEQKRIFIKKEHKELENQILYFPQIKFDDLLDALKSQINIVFPSDKEPTKNNPNKTVLTFNEKRVWNDLKKFDGKRQVRRMYDDYW